MREAQTKSSKCFWHFLPLITQWALHFVDSSPNIKTTTSDGNQIAKDREIAQILFCINVFFFFTQTHNNFVLQAKRESNSYECKKESNTQIRVNGKMSKLVGAEYCTEYFKHPIAESRLR